MGVAGQAGVLLLHVDRYCSSAMLDAHSYPHCNSSHAKGAKEEVDLLNELIALSGHL